MSALMRKLGRVAGVGPRARARLGSAAVEDVATGGTGDLLRADGSGEDLTNTAGSFWNKGYETNRYYTDYVPNSAATFAVTADRLYGYVFWVRHKTTFTRIGIEITTAAGTNARLGIYNWDPVAANRTLVVDAGTVSTSGIAIVEATISQALDPGPYILAAVFDNTPTCRSHGGTMLGGLATGWSTPATANDCFFYTAHVFAALPTPFGALTYTDPNTGTPVMPKIWLRVV